MNKTSAYPDSIVVRAMREIRDHLRALKDPTGRRVFAHNNRVQFGIGPGGHRKPAGEDMPVLRLWSDVLNGISSNQQFLVTSWQFDLSMYLYMFIPEGIDNEQQTNAFEYRQALAEYIVRSLSEPESGTSGNDSLMPSLSIDSAFGWSFVEDQIVVIDHANIFKRAGTSFIVEPPMYATRIDVTVKTRGMYLP